MNSVSEFSFLYYDECVKRTIRRNISAVKGMEIIHMQGIGGGITGTLMDGIVQNELSVGTDLGIISGFEPVSYTHLVFRLQIIILFIFLPPI